MIEKAKVTIGTEKGTAPMKKKCFIIMPITTPQDYINRHRDKQHFEHILDHLFLPAIEKAGLEPVKPIASGSELINKRTIEEIERSDLALCDISTHNPNVFFELGIRTALDLPVCLVKDDLTEAIPFDTFAINHYTYRSSLSKWDYEREIEDLATHISLSYDSSHKGNELWTAFSISANASRPNKSVGIDAQMAYLIRLVESLANEIRHRFHPRPDIGAYEYQGHRTPDIGAIEAQGLPGQDRG